MAEVKTFMVEDARIMYRNFAGKEGPFNPKGQRNFAVVLDPETAEQLAQDGWAVRFTKPREEGDIPVPFISVRVKFDVKPPRIVMLTTRSRVNLDEGSVEVLDFADIEKVDLICNAYEWDIGGKSGVKAYLKSMFITIAEDALERKYAINEVGGDDTSEPR